MTNNISMDEALKQSLSNLKLEGYVQPLFKVEKFVEAKKIWKHTFYDKIRWLI